MKFLEWIRGYKRIGAAILAIITAVLVDVVGLDATAAQLIVGILGTFILGQSFTDAAGYSPLKAEVIVTEGKEIEAVG